MNALAPTPRSRRTKGPIVPWPGVLAAVACLVVIHAGVDTLLSVTAIGLQALFIVFFLRHFGFTIAALQTAPYDLVAPRLDDAGGLPSVTVLVACKNEQAVVRTLVTSLLSLDYPDDLLEIVVVDDGSADDTGPLLDAAAAQEPRLMCLHRRRDAPSGKAGALNDGLAVARGDIVVVFDADHRPTADVVRRLVRHFKDPRVAAVQGRCEIDNGSDSELARLISIDYMAGYLINEYGRQSLFELPAYGGANCAVRASALRAAGGWNHESVTEDTDLTVRLMLLGHRIRYDVTAVDREESVLTLGRFWRQRYRWARGHQQVCRDYRGLVLSSRRLSRLEKLETLMFLHVFHLPVASALGLSLIVLSATGVIGQVASLNLLMIWTLLFLGPLLEIGGALLIGRADRRDALSIAYFLPLFLLSIALCTKAWLDGVMRRRYQWVKTQRARDSELAPA